MNLPKLKVLPDPRYIGRHPLHQARYIVTEDSYLEVDEGDGCVGVADVGQIIATMNDCEQQADLARVMAAAPELLAALEDQLDALNAWDLFATSDAEDVRLGIKISHDKITRLLAKLKGQS